MKYSVRLSFQSRIFSMCTSTHPSLLPRLFSFTVKSCATFRRSLPLRVYLHWEPVPLPGSRTLHTGQSCGKQRGKRAFSWVCQFAIKISCWHFNSKSGLEKRLEMRSLHGFGAERIYAAQFQGLLLHAVLPHPSHNRLEGPAATQQYATKQHKFTMTKTLYVCFRK